MILYENEHTCQAIREVNTPADLLENLKKLGELIVTIVDGLPDDCPGNETYILYLTNDEDGKSRCGRKFSKPLKTTNTHLTKVIVKYFKVNPNIIIYRHLMEINFLSRNPYVRGQ